MAADWLNVALAVLMLTDLLLLLTGKLQAMVRLVAIQGVMICAVPLLTHWPDVGWALWAVALGNFVVKSIGFPWLTFWTARRVHVRGQLEPGANYVVSIAAGVLFLIASLWLGARLEPPEALKSSLSVPVALLTVLTGLFLIIARQKALTQVAGYLVLENGIFTFGTSLAWEQPVIVEMGILLDVFAALFVMGITVFHIGRTFDSIDVAEMTSLRDTRR